jgi:hypothetical protein
MSDVRHLVDDLVSATSPVPGIWDRLGNLIYAGVWVVHSSFTGGILMSLVTGVRENRLHGFLLAPIVSLQDSQGHDHTLPIGKVVRYQGRLPGDPHIESKEG